MVLTGAALRQKFYFNVYAVASYVQEGAKPRTPEELAAVNCPKRLELVMERHGRTARRWRKPFGRPSA